MRTRTLLCGAVSLVLSAAPSAGWASSDQSGQKPSSHEAAGKPAKPKADPPTSKHLLGDWNTKLSEQGIDLSFKYQGDVGAAVSGGKSHGVDYAQQLELGAKFDWDKIANIKGLTSTVTFVNRLGQSVSHNHIGDHLFQVETIYGGTHHAAIHLVDAFADW